MNGWISVGERMPEFDVGVLCWNGREPITGYHNSYYGESEWHINSGSSILRVTHWMPLPPPPGSEQAGPFHITSRERDYFRDVLEDLKRKIDKALQSPDRAPEGTEPK